MHNQSTNDAISIKYAMVAALMFFVGACASSHIPAPNTSEAEANINQAEEAGAQQYAPLDLRRARKKLDNAKKLIDKEKYKQATQLVEETSVDAELATAKARSKKAQEAVKQLRETIETLRKEIQRNQSN